VLQSYSKYLKIAVVVGAGLTAGVALWDAVVRASWIMTIVLLSMFVAAAYEPGVNKLTRGGRRSRRLVAAFLLGSTLLVFGGLLAACGALLYAQLDDLLYSIPDLVANIENTVNKHLGLNVDLQQYTANLSVTDMGAGLLALGESFLKISGAVLVVLFLSYYLIVDGPAIRQRICTLFPVRIQKEVLRMWDITVEKTGNYIYSRVLLGLFTFLSHGAVFYVMGVPYAIVLALWAAVVSQVIPVLGTYVAGGVPLLVVGAQGSGSLVVMMLVFMVLYQQLENMVISPKLLKKTMDLNPVVSFVGVLVAASTLNFVYVLLALPIIATTQAFVTVYVQTHELVEDERFNTPT